MVAQLLAILVVNHVYKKHKGRRRQHDFRNLSQREKMAMLIHCAYFSDLNCVGDFLATYMGYQNPRAENYGKLYWESLQPDCKKSELKGLGLYFFLRKSHHSSLSAPELAIVVRGTIPYKVEDLKADYVIAEQKLHLDERISRTEKLILKEVKKFIDHYGGTGTISMAGHSLGAAILFQVGKRLYLRHRINIETHLFSPPMLTFRDFAALNMFKRSHVSYTSSSRNDNSYLWSTMLGKSPALQKLLDEFKCMQGWAPHYYLNPRDLICHLFINYFKEGKEKTTTAAGRERFFAGLFSEDPNLLPNVPSSAHVHISSAYSWNPIKSHSVRQYHKFGDKYLSRKVEVKMYDSDQ